MKRIDTTTKSVDLFGVGKHGFQDGNKALGIAATQLDSTIFNNVQEEIARVVEAAGITLDGTVYTQLLAAIQSGKLLSATAAGTDTLTATFSYAPTLVHGLTLHVRAVSANTTTAPTFNANGTGAIGIVKGNGLALAAGDIAGAGHWLELQYDATLVKWVLLNPLSHGNLLNIQVFSAAGSSTYTPTPGTSSVVVEVQGGGGGGGGGAEATSVTEVAVAAPGSSGAYGKGRYTSAFSGVTVTVGSGGAAGASNAAGGNGGASSFGALLSAPAGFGGGAGGAQIPPVAGFPGLATSPSSGGNIINAAGGLGSAGVGITPSNGILSHGGSTPFGMGPSGSAGVSYGTGGAGAFNQLSTAASVGVAGKNGIVVVWEYS